MSRREARRLPSWWRAVAGFVEAGGRRRGEWRERSSLAVVALVVPAAVTYGVAMSSYAGLGGDRWAYVMIGATKVPILFGATLFIAVPCFYVLHQLLGVGDDFPAVWRGLVDYQLSVAFQLLSLTPVTIFVNLTTDSYRLVQLWNVVVFTGVAVQAQGSLRALYAELTSRQPVHRYLRRFWLGIYAFVGIQLGWSLRPFFGNPKLPPQFLRDEIGNAYVEVFAILQTALEQIF
ncbi:MAG: hypothetical protein AAF488_14055 [Planctomycetota bacterium]